MAYVNLGEESDSSAMEKTLCAAKEINRLSAELAECREKSKKLTNDMCGMVLELDKFKTYNSELKEKLKQSDLKIENMVKELGEKEVLIEQITKERDECKSLITFANEDKQECKKMLGCFVHCLQSENFHSFESYYSASPDLNNKTEKKLKDDVRAAMKFVQQKIVETTNECFRLKKTSTMINSLMRQVCSKGDLAIKGVINVEDFYTPSKSSSFSENEFKGENFQCENEKSSMQQFYSWAVEDNTDFVTGLEESGNKEKADEMEISTNCAENVEPSENPGAGNNSELQDHVKDSPPHFQDDENDNDNSAELLAFHEFYSENSMDKGGNQDEETAKMNSDEIVDTNTSLYSTTTKNKVQRQKKRFMCELCTNVYRSEAMLREHLCKYNSNNNHVVAIAKLKKTVVKERNKKRKGGVRKSNRLSQLRKKVLADRRDALHSQTVGNVEIKVGHVQVNETICSRGKRFKKTSSLKQHILNPMENFECQVCKKTFGHKGHLKQHMKSGQHQKNAIKSLAENQRKEKERIDKEAGKGSEEELTNDKMEGLEVASGSFKNGDIEKQGTGNDSPNNNDLEGQQLESSSSSTEDLEGHEVGSGSPNIEDMEQQGLEPCSPNNEEIDEQRCETGVPEEKEVEEPDQDLLVDQLIDGGCLSSLCEVFMEGTEPDFLDDETIGSILHGNEQTQVEEPRVGLARSDDDGSSFVDAVE